MALVQARGLNKVYAGKTAVSSLSFDVLPGSVTGFLGPNGAGKSTTMRLMLGLDNGEGTTTFDGVPYHELEHPLRRVGTVLDAKPFHPTRTARNHLRMLAASNDIPITRVNEVIRLVGLGDVATKRPKSFSLGMGQRLGLAAAMLGDPDTLILDEPANGLDPQGVHWLRGMLKQLAGEGRSVFVSSHLLSEMALMADQLVVVGRGQLIASGNIKEFISTSRRNAVVVRADDNQKLGQKLYDMRAEVRPEDGRLVVTGLDLEQVSQVAFDLRVRVIELFHREATLEEAFLDATGASEEFRASMGFAAPGGGFGPGGPPPPGYAGPPAPGGPPPGYAQPGGFPPGNVPPHQGGPA